MQSSQIPLHIKQQNIHVTLLNTIWICSFYLRLAYCFELVRFYDQVAYWCRIVISSCNSWGLVIVSFSHILELLSVVERIQILLCLVMSGVVVENQMVKLLGWIGNSNNYEIIRFQPSPSKGQLLGLDGNISKCSLSRSFIFKDTTIVGFGCCPN